MLIKTNNRTLTSPDGAPLDKQKEWLKCRLSPLYFIENYISIPVAGGSLTMGNSDLWKATRKYRDFIKLAASPNVDNLEILFSRQHGKTTTIMAFLLHQMIFYPELKIQFLTLSKENAFDVIERAKFMLERLPNFLQQKPKGKGDKKTYLELENGSRITTKYVSGNIDPDRIGRGFSVPMVWIDEAAFIPHMETVWAAMQPSISAARIQAKKNNFPTKIFLSTTPNGAGTNWFYNTWIRGWDYEEIFDFENNKVLENAEEILNSKDERNNFARVKIHWSETGKDEEWYKRQVKELGFNMRKVSQELDLVFLGSTNAVFDDEILEKFQPKSPVNEITMAYGEKFNIYSEIDPNSMYILGVDTAASTAAKSDYSALVLTDAKTGEEVGSWHGKYSVVKRFAVVVKSLIQGLNSLFALNEDTLIVVIERNSFGLGVVEELMYDDGGFDYMSYLYHETKKNERIPGLQTTAKSRDQMFNFLLSAINEIPERAKSALLQEELRNLEQKASGRFEAGSGNHDDVIMAYNFTLFVRHELLSKGIIEEDGKTSILDLDRIKYYLDVSMTSALPKDLQENPPEIEGHQIIDEKKERERILKEMGINPKTYEPLPTMDNYVITF